MRHTQTDGKYVIKIEKGENVVETLTAFAKEQGISNGHFNGIGAVEYLKCGYYALGEKKYYFTEYEDLVEVVSLTGNIMLLDGSPFVHVHGVFTDTSNSAFGGHIVEMRVGVVLEVILIPLSSKIERKMEESIGLCLMDLKIGE